MPKITFITREGKETVVTDGCGTLMDFGREYEIEGIAGDCGGVRSCSTEVHGHSVPASGRVSLAWSSARRDPEVFQNPNTAKLDRKPNTHVAFGFGVHNCLGAHHAPAAMRKIIEKLSERVDSIEIVEREEHIEQSSVYARKIGYEKLVTQWRSA